MIITIDKLKEVLMKKGINAWSFPENMSISEQMDLALTAGFEGYEPAFNLVGDLSMESKDTEIIKVSKMAGDKGIEITSLSTGLYWQYPCTSENETIREKSIQILRRQLECAALLGVDTILVVPGQVSKVVCYDEAWDRALDAISSQSDYAKNCNVKIGIENVWNKFLLSPLEMKNFIDIIDNKYVGVYLDVGNMLAYGYPEHWIKILGDKIFKVHVKDFRLSVGNINGFVDLLAGDVDFPSVTNALNDIGYDDYLIAEMGKYNHYSTQIIYNTSSALDRIIKMK